MKKWSKEVKSLDEDILSSLKKIEKELSSIKSEINNVYNQIPYTSDIEEKLDKIIELLETQ
jgi:methyl-accepting chemotaxis protein